MTIATHEEYIHMLNTARQEGYAYPAINVTSTQTLNAALQGLAEAESDGIIQVSVGGSDYFSGQSLHDRVVGSLAFSAFAHEVAERYPHITVALHTDHCPKQYLGQWVEPLLHHEIEQVKRGKEPSFNSHMWDGSAVDLTENLQVARRLLDLSKEARTILEIEIGAVGGEEDGLRAKEDSRLYSTAQDAIQVAQVLGLGEQGIYMAAFTFGNVHGSYKPGMVKLKPEILGEIQSAVAHQYCSSQNTQCFGYVNVENSKSPSVHAEKPFFLVFHGGSGSTSQEIMQAVNYGVVKMNIDTDLQYAFSRGVADHMFKHYNQVLKIDGEVGEKKFYDPRSWGRMAENSMANRVVEACRELGSVGKAIKL